MLATQMSRDKTMEMLIRLGAGIDIQDKVYRLTSLAIEQT